VTEMLHQCGHILCVPIEVVGLDARRMVTPAVSTMVKEDALISIRKRLHVSSRSPHIRVAARAEVQKQEGTRAFELVVKPSPVRRDKERHFERSLCLRGNQLRQVDGRILEL
jgi:hypothetical protein